MEFFCKLYTSSNLVIYTFTFRYISQQGLSSGQIFFGMHKIPNGFKISFFPMENLFFPIHFHK